ncbi:spidroin-1-like [Eucalyptus grandis]|uniref:spidroin-1-like n=1 Tax=Eucalyptus grandis TaxID=71139 RepID=UPI00192ED759|nr:spidroin-1-like [Eucalyptus grandis]
MGRRFTGARAHGDGLRGLGPRLQAVLGGSLRRALGSRASAGGAPGTAGGLGGCDEARHRRKGSVEPGPGLRRRGPRICKRRDSGLDLDSAATGSPVAWDRRRGGAGRGRRRGGGARLGPRRITGKVDTRAASGGSHSGEDSDRHGGGGVGGGAGWGRAEASRAEGEQQRRGGKECDRLGSSSAEANGPSCKSWARRMRERRGSWTETGGYVGAGRRLGARARLGPTRGGWSVVGQQERSRTEGLRQRSVGIVRSGEWTTGRGIRSWIGLGRRSNNVGVGTRRWLASAPRAEMGRRFTGARAHGDGLQGLGSESQQAVLGGSITSVDRTVRRRSSGQSRMEQSNVGARLGRP